MDLNHSSMGPQRRFLFETDPASETSFIHIQWTTSKENSPIKIQDSFHKSLEPTQVSCSVTSGIPCNNQISHFKGWLPLLWSVVSIPTFQYGDVADALFPCSIENRM
jgi:hypothetical protein